MAASRLLHNHCLQQNRGKISAEVAATERRWQPAEPSKAAKRVQWPDDGLCRVVICPEDGGFEFGFQGASRFKGLRLCSSGFKVSGLRVGDLRVG